MAAAPVTSRNSDTSSAGNGRASLLLEHFGAILMALTDFVLFQTVAVLLCVAIYFTIPALDASIRQGGDDWNWIDIFRIVSPTFTVSGGAVTVLTSYFFARKSQEEARLRQEEAKLRQEAETRAATAEAQLEALKSQMGQPVTSRRRNRRRLRNGPSQRER
ncbi:MAG: hypothetical protein OXF79_18915 [Chloroflexi bacterium]|nr:hypothetical protein [Chloroflexota bacterium]